MTDLTALYQAVVDGDAPAAQTETEQALAGGLPAETILHDGLIHAMGEVGRRFEEGEYFLPEMLISAQAMKKSLAILRPVLASRQAETSGRVAAGTVKGDLHDIGKNLVGMMLEGAGYEVQDLGVDVPPEKFVAAVQNEQVQVIALSALLTTTMPTMRLVVQALRDAGVREQVKVVVGGAPVTQEFADSIGADGFAHDASSAVRLVNRLLGQGQ